MLVMCVLAMGMFFRCLPLVFQHWLPIRVMLVTVVMSAMRFVGHAIPPVLLGVHTRYPSSVALLYTSIGIAFGTPITATGAEVERFGATQQSLPLTTRE